MDPHIQAVYTPEQQGYHPSFIAHFSDPLYQKDRITEEIAYELARRYNQPLTHGIGRLTEQDLIDIASFKPKVTWDQYIKYKGKDFDQLLEEFPELDELTSSVNGSINWLDAFHYATRSEERIICDRSSETPNYLETSLTDCYPVINVFPRHAPNTQESIERYKLYQSLSEVGKGLLNLLYRDVVGFSQANEPHHLEKYIVAFDQNLGDKGTIISLANRMGFEIVDDEKYPSYEQFIDLLTDHINKVEKPTVITKDRSYIKSSQTRLPSINSKAYTGTSNVIPNTKQMINMTRSEFDKLLSSHGFQPSLESYNNRLSILPQLL